MQAEESEFTLGERIFEVHHFYPLSSESDISLNIIYETLQGFFCDDYVPFADDAGGWQYVISIKESDKGLVYLCRMDEPLGNGFTHIADSFSDFINGLIKPAVA